jgi:hypothetical protein
MFGGVAMGHSYVRAASRGDATGFIIRLGLTSAVLAATGVLLDRVPFTAYPEHDFWKTSPLFFLVRVAGVLQLTVIFYFLRNISGRIRSVLTTLGQSSLLIYTTHIVIVYGSAAAPGLLQTVGQTQPPIIAAVAGALVLLLMLMLSRGWDYLRMNHMTTTHFVQAGMTGAVVYLFLLRPF